MEMIKIMEIIDRWGYLNTEQIALLINKQFKNVERQLSFLKQKKLILINQVTRKNIYYLSNLGKRFLGKENKKSKLNLNQLAHQDLMIKWVSKQKDIASYENELELKSWNSKQDRYPDLMIEYENGTKVWVEIERTRKSKERIEDKLDNMREHIKDNHKVIWVVPDNKNKWKIMNNNEREIIGLDFYFKLIFLANVFKRLKNKNCFWLDN